MVAGERGRIEVRRRERSGEGVGEEVSLAWEGERKGARKFGESD